jgi:TPP-dependent pyruvate/acetoin dehydrogenase alpha subunit
VFGARLQEQGVATAATLAQIDRDVREALEAAVAFAKASPLPQPEDALGDFQKSSYYDRVGMLR